MNNTTGGTKEHHDKTKLRVLRCHKELNGTVGAYPYRRISDELQKLIRENGRKDVVVERIGSARASMASNRRCLPNGDVVWLSKKASEPWKPTDTLFSLDYPYNWGEALFDNICRYFASIPDMNGRWEVKIVDNDTQPNWRISANEETYEFVLENWKIIPDSDPMFLSECTAEQVKEWLLDRYERTKRRQNQIRVHTTHDDQEKWLYIEEGNVIQYFYEKSELAQYIYASDTPKDGTVKLVYEDDLLKEDLATSVNDTAKEFLARYERFNPLFPPRDKEVPNRLRQTRYVIGGKKWKAQDLWEMRYRSQIDFLIRSGSENHIVALVSMLPCMDLVYKLKTGKSKSNWIKTLKMFFPAFGFEHTAYKQLANLIRNGFVHDGFTKGYVGISSAHHTPEEYTDREQVFTATRTETGEFKLLIIPAFFWARVRDKIDSFYRYEQWIPGEAMHKVVTLSHYIKPITREELT